MVRYEHITKQGFLSCENSEICCWWCYISKLRFSGIAAISTSLENNSKINTLKSLVSHAKQSVVKFST